jgi:hypothetical protein
LQHPTSAPRLIAKPAERVRPANGYPMRLLLPGFEGNMNVKWLRRVKLTEGPTMTKDETSKYTITMPHGKSLQFVFPQEGKSVITRPSPGLTMKEPGIYEITGLAWSGYGKITKVEISADGGKSWAPAGHLSAVESHCSGLRLRRVHGARRQAEARQDMARDGLGCRRRHWRRCDGFDRLRSRRRLVSERKTNPCDNHVPLALFRSGITDQHAVHVSVRPVTAIVPGPVLMNAGYREEARCHPLVLDASRRMLLG